MDAAWAALEAFAAGLPMPASFGVALEKAKRGFFAPDYTELRMKTLKSLIAGEKLNMTAEDWSLTSVPKLASLVEVAEATLNVATDQAASQHAMAMRSLAGQCWLLCA